MKWLAIFFALIPWTASAAYYAELDKNDRVVRVVVVDASAEVGVDGSIREANGIAWCQKLFGGGTWIKTDTDGLRKHYAGVGYVYDPNIDAFVPPQPFPSWVLDRVNAIWIAPIAMPKGGPYAWDEAKSAWVAVSPP